MTGAAVRTRGASAGHPGDALERCEISDIQSLLFAYTYSQCLSPIHIQ